MAGVRVGWYCPFSYSLLSPVQELMLVRISWNHASNQTFGAIKLCKKLSFIYYGAETAGLDGLVLADCCNLSHWMSYYIRKKFSPLGINVYIMNIPRKVNGSFFAHMLYEAEQVKAWAGSLSRRVSHHPAVFAAVAADHGNAEEEPDNSWCNLAEGMAMGIELYRDPAMAEILLGKVNCPRLFSDTMERDILIRQSVVPAAADDECVLQQYFHHYLADAREGIR